MPKNNYHETILKLRFLKLYFNCFQYCSSYHEKIAFQRLAKWDARIMYYVGYAGWTAVAAPAGYQSTLP